MSNQDNQRRSATHSDLRQAAHNITKGWKSWTLVVSVGLVIITIAVLVVLGPLIRS